MRGDVFTVARGGPTLCSGTSWEVAMNLGSLCFSFSGRINRAKWWLVILLFIILEINYFILAMFLPVIVTIILSIALIVALIWMSLAAGVKRLHDLDRTGAWLLVFILTPIVLYLILFLIAGASLFGALMSSGENLDVSALASAGLAGTL